MSELTITSEDGTTGDLLAHVAELQCKALILDDVKARAERGLDFAHKQLTLTAGFPNAVYWRGKIDAYEAILELI